MRRCIFAAAVGAAILTIPAAALADSDHSKERDHKPVAKTVTFAFKGVFTAPGTIEVRSGNAHVRKGGFIGQKISFDLTAARVVAADRNGDRKVDVADVMDGDVVLVQARLNRRAKFVAPAEGETVAAIAARKLIDRTSPPADAE